MNTNTQTLNPDFSQQDVALFQSGTFKNHINELVGDSGPFKPPEILKRLLAKVSYVDFHKLAGIEEDKKVPHGTFQILTVEEILRLAVEHNWGLCCFQAGTYIYNGAYWSYISEDDLKSFLGKAAERMSVNKFHARHFRFRENLLKQFFTLSHLPSPVKSRDVVLINLINGTFEISVKGTKIKEFDRNDFIRYQLPFEFNPSIKALKFMAYINRVLPDLDSQKILAEYLAYIFIPNTRLDLKLEKTLLLFGPGANGKSVFFDITNALLGPENISSYSLQSLTGESGYFRAKLGDKLLNYASEISGKLETALFKQMISGEPIEARLPYRDPIILDQYARLIFNCNELPKDIEHTPAYFRRFLIIPFDVTIPEEEQNKGLASEIIKEELSGVFNWILEGLNRLLRQQNFSYSEAVNQQIELYRKESDSVKMYLEDKGFSPSATEYELIKEIYTQYRAFCLDDGYKPVNKTNFIKRLKSSGIIVERKSQGNVAFISKPYDSYF